MDVRRDLARASIGFGIACAAGSTQLATAQPATSTQVLPTMKPGHWRFVSESSDANGTEKNQGQACMDAALSQLLLLGQRTERVSKGADCPTTVKREGNAYIAEYACRIDTSTFSMSSDVTGDFARQVQAAVTIKESPIRKDGFNINQKIAYTWVSASCPAGWKPGDVEDEGGERVNLVELSQFTDRAAAAAEKLGKQGEKLLKATDKLLENLGFGGKK